MSNEVDSFFAKLESAAMAAITDFSPFVPIAQEIAGVVGKLDPAVAPVIAGAEAAVSSIAALAPNAVAIATTALSAVQNIRTSAAPVITEFEAEWDKLFHITAVPGGVLLSAKTSTATVPVTATLTPAAAAAS